MNLAKEDRLREETRFMVGQMAKIEREGWMHWANEDMFREEERSMVGEMVRNERAALIIKNYQDLF